MFNLCSIYRELRIIKNSIILPITVENNYTIVGYKQIDSDITIEKSLDAISTMTVSLRDRGRTFMLMGQIGSTEAPLSTVGNTEAPLSTVGNTEAPLSRGRFGSFSMLNRMVEFLGGYIKPDGTITKKKLFRGKINKVTPSFDSDGFPKVQFTAFDNGDEMARRKHTFTYPAFSDITVETIDVTTLSGTNITLKKLVGNVQAKTRLDRIWRLVNETIGINEISLLDIVQNIALEYKLEAKLDEDYLKTFTFDGKEKKLNQTRESDWNFLKRLAERYGCYVNIEIDENDNDVLIFEHIDKKQKDSANEQLQAQSQSLLGVTGVEGDVEFFYHPVAEAGKTYKFVKQSEFDPTNPKGCKMPLNDVDLDVDNLSSGGIFIEHAFDLNGNETFIAQKADEPGVIYILDESKLSGKDADEFFRDYEPGVSNWDDIKKFWIIEGTGTAPQLETRVRRAQMGVSLRFSSIGYPFARLGRWYKVNNIDPFIPKRTITGESGREVTVEGWLLTKISHVFGDTYSTSWEFTA